MAARKVRTELAADWRAKIKTSMLINRLQAFSLGEKEARGGKPVTMTSDQVRAAQALLKKVMPDLTSTTLGGDPENPIRTISTIELVPVEPKGKE